LFFVTKTIFSCLSVANASIEPDKFSISVALTKIEGELGNFDIETGLEETFDEIAILTSKCRFKNCSHTREKDCALLSALEEGRISEERYRNFIKITKDTLKNLTYQEIGNIINKNHATVIHSKKTIENLLTYDANVQKNYQDLLDLLTVDEENLDELTYLELKRITKSLIKENKLLKLQLQK